MNLPYDRKVDLLTIERIVRICLILFVIAAVLLSGCAALVLPVAGSDTALTPLEAGAMDVTYTSDGYTDLETFTNSSVYPQVENLSPIAVYSWHFTREI